MQNLIVFGELEALGVCPCRLLSRSAKLEALARACPCRILLLWGNWRHWVCAHLDFYCFGTAKSIGHYPVQNLIALAELEA